MMRFGIVDTATGQILQMAMADTVGPIADMLLSGQVAVEVEDRSIDDSTHYAEGTTLVPFPTKPARTSRWDWSLKQWVD